MVRISSKQVSFLFGVDADKKEAEEYYLDIQTDAAVQRLPSQFRIREKRQRRYPSCATRPMRDLNHGQRAKSGRLRVATTRKYKDLAQR